MPTGFGREKRDTGTSGFNVSRGEDADEEDGGDKTDDDTDQDCVESEYFFC